MSIVMGSSPYNNQFTVINFTAENNILLFLTSSLLVVLRMYPLYIPWLFNEQSYINLSSRCTEYYWSYADIGEYVWLTSIYKTLVKANVT